MRIVLFCHSLLSDWNHGNAHFLRGIVTDLEIRGVQVDVYERRDAWSVANLVSEHGPAALLAARKAYPLIEPVRYDDALDLRRAVADADLVLVHEWNDPVLVRALGDLRKQGGSFRLLFHDTHHRSVTAPHEIARYDLSGYDGVLAFGGVVRDIYLSTHKARRAWTWHEAADARVFRPMACLAATESGTPYVNLRRVSPKYDVVWIGNWGDEERSEELHEFLLGPVKRLGLRARIHGVRYPEAALAALRDAGIEYGGWLPNFEVPRLFASARATVHVPRRPYAKALPGIPTIRPFEAMACGIPLVCAPWNDAEGLFTPGRDYLVARDGAEMDGHLSAILTDEPLRHRLATHGRETILARHTCAHRVDELLRICSELGIDTSARASA
jgi:spore maturation protein CgeB